MNTEITSVRQIFTCCLAVSNSALIQYSVLIEIGLGASVMLINELSLIFR